MHFINVIMILYLHIQFIFIFSDILLCFNYNLINYIILFRIFILYFLYNFINILLF